MRVPSLVLLVGALALAIVAPLAGQSAKWTPPRTPDGKPDLQGTFTFATITPLQRPDALKDKEFLTPEEAADFEKAENDRLNRDLFDPEKGQPSAGYPGRAQGGVLSYNDFWYERGDKIVGDRRSSLITDPPDGRIPYSAATRARNAERARRPESDQFSDPEALSLVDQCILGFNSGPPMISGTYNNNLQIVQTPGYVVIFNEMVHNARIIPTDGRPHGPLPQWTGDSVGHWEGDTLVVETKNFKRETSLPGSTAKTIVVERFTRVAPRTIDYKFTITDPDAYSRPWTASEPLQAIDEQLFEYACHEANYGMEGVLRGARYREKEAASKK
jgi:hypothetical protein